MEGVISTVQNGYKPKGRHVHSKASVICDGMEKAELNPTNQAAKCEYQFNNWSLCGLCANTPFVALLIALMF